MAVRCFDADKRPYISFVCQSIIWLQTFQRFVFHKMAKFKCQAFLLRRNPPPLWLISPAGWLTHLTANVPALDRRVFTTRTPPIGGMWMNWRYLRLSSQLFHFILFVCCLARILGKRTDLFHINRWDKDMSRFLACPWGLTTPAIIDFPALHFRRCCRKEAQ